MDDIEKGITKAIAQHNIRWLVMGAAAADGYNLGYQFQTSVALILIYDAQMQCVSDVTYSIWRYYYAKNI